MADNVGYTPGSGATIAADDVAGNLHQRVKITLGSDGVSEGDLSSNNPLPIITSGSTTVNVSTGELIESMEAMRMALQALTRTIGLSLPDAAGRQRVLIDSMTSGITLSSVSSLGTLATLQGAGTNNYNLNDAVPSLMHMQADNLRRNITVS
jgi:hypothetical protein